jgi:hypothetical protein
MALFLAHLAKIIAVLISKIMATLISKYGYFNFQNYGTSNSGVTPVCGLGTACQYCVNTSWPNPKPHPEIE